MIGPGRRRTGRRSFVAAVLAAVLLLAACGVDQPAVVARLDVVEVEAGGFATVNVLANDLVGDGASLLGLEHPDGLVADISHAPNGRVEVTSVGAVAWMEYVASYQVSSGGVAAVGALVIRIVDRGGPSRLPPPTLPTTTTAPPTTTAPTTVPPTTATPTTVPSTTAAPTTVPPTTVPPTTAPPTVPPTTEPSTTATPTTEPSTTSSTEPPPDPVVGILVRPTKLDFGSVLVDGRYTATVDVTNVDGVTVGLSASTVPAPFAIDGSGCTTPAPETTCTISVSLTPVVTGPVRATLIVTGTAPDHRPARVPIELSATVEAPTPDPAVKLRVAPLAVDFGPVRADRPRGSAVVRVVNEDEVEVDLSVSDVAPPFAIYDDACTTLRQQETCTIGISLVPGDVGPAKASLKVTGTAPGRRPTELAIDLSAILEAPPVDPEAVPIDRPPSGSGIDE